LRQAISPFEAPSPHPGHCTPNIPSKEIKKRSDAYAKKAAGCSQMSLDEKLLPRISHCDKQDIGFGTANQRNNLWDFTGIEMPVVTTNDLMPWTQLGQTMCCAFGDARRRPE